MADTPVQPHNEAPQPESTPASPGIDDATVKGGRSDPIVLDAVGHGTPEATAASVEDATHGAHHEKFLGLDSYGWVAGAFLVFVLLLLKLKAPAAIGQALDSRGAKIRAELDEAKRLRADAEALLAQYQSQQRQAAADAAKIMEHAKAEAEQLVEAAKANAEQLVQRRTRMAEDRIAAAETAATADLRARVATLAAETAKTMLAAQMSDADKTRLADEAIAGLGSR